ncbi:MAG TPA: crosslink repair DNA glycosylase YcaQ family protein [Candidatus Limnocylindria bacterium]|nr:crosslink repair DNA glycosylase YcaQ family protein [Candidatus Limnocylindria bacterium]
MPLRIDWRQALAWRMKRQLLDPIGDGSVTDVVRQLGAVQAQVASSAELAIRLRRRTSRAGEVAAAVTRGDLLKTWAMRGALHLITPREGAAFLSVIAAGRSWERPSWQRYFGLTPEKMGRFRETVREAMDGTTLSREDIVAAVAADPVLVNLADELRSGWGTLLKPLAWQGDLCFGPSEGNRVRFMRPDDASPKWTGLPDPEEAMPMALAAYLRTYGPAAPDAFGRWLAGGWFPRRRLKAAFTEMGDRITEVEVDGESAFVRSEDLDELAATRPTAALRMLGGFDQYVLGPGTDDGHVTAPERRRDVSRQSGWIAPVVVHGGRASATWKLDGDRVLVEWFAESGRVPRTALAREVLRLASILERDLELEVASIPIGTG